MIGIYKIENLLNGKVYIGGSKNIKRRWQQHLTRLRNNKHKSSHLQNSFNKYGQQAFKFTTVLECQSEKLFYFEDIYIKIYQSIDRKFGYNLTNVDPSTGVGLNDSLETKEKLRRVVYLRHYGNTTEKEYQDWKTELQLERDRVKGLLHTNAKAVFQIDKTTGEVVDRFKSVADAARGLGTQNVEVLRRAVLGKVKTHKGFVFVYETLYDSAYDYRVLPKSKPVATPRVPFKGNPVKVFNIVTQEIKDYQSVAELAEEINSPAKYIYRVIGKGTRTYKNLRIKYLKDVDISTLESGAIIINI